MPAQISRRVLAGLVVAAAAPGLALAATDRRQVARRLSEVVRLEYQDEAAAGRLADAIARKLAAGAYDDAAIPDAELAARLTADLQAVVKDGHMAVMSGMPGGAPPPSLDPDFALRQNYGVQAVRRLGGNVGLIELNFSPGLRFGDALFDRYAAAMALVGDTRALVLDLRQHMGGEPAAVAYFVSYFFDRAPFVVNRIRYRTKPTEAFSTTAAPRGRKYGETRPVFVLMSKASFSDLQATKRARVVGEVSGGGANPNQAYDLGQGFVALIPNGAAINPVTGTNWEGVGVKPDTPTTAADALGVAHRLALEAALAQATAESERQSIRQAIDGLGT